MTGTDLTDSDAEILGVGVKIFFSTIFPFLKNVLGLRLLSNQSVSLQMERVSVMKSYQIGNERLKMQVPNGS